MQLLKFNFCLALLFLSTRMFAASQYLTPNRTTQEIHQSIFDTILSDSEFLSATKIRINPRYLDTGLFEFNIFGFNIDVTVARFNLIQSTPDFNLMSLSQLLAIPTINSIVRDQIKSTLNDLEYSEKHRNGIIWFEKQIHLGPDQEPFEAWTKAKNQPESYWVRNSCLITGCSLIVANGILGFVVNQGFIIGALFLGLPLVKAGLNYKNNNGGTWSDTDWKVYLEDTIRMLKCQRRNPLYTNHWELLVAYKNFKSQQFQKTHENVPETQSPGHSHPGGNMHAPLLADVPPTQM